MGKTSAAMPVRHFWEEGGGCKSGGHASCWDSNELSAKSEEGSGASKGKQLLVKGARRCALIPGGGTHVRSLKGSHRGRRYLGADQRIIESNLLRNAIQRRGTGQAQKSGPHDGRDGKGWIKRI